MVLNFDVDEQTFGLRLSCGADGGRISEFKISMSPAGACPQVARFGRFEADFRACELRKEGSKIRLQEQPFQILAALLEHPGEVVTRMELQRRLWPADTFVDFDHGLNSAIGRLREALNDSAGTPKYIETVGRRGYRFIAPVEKLDAEIAEPVLPTTAPQTAKWTVHFAPAGRLALVFSFVGVLVVATVVLGLNLRSPVPTVIDSLQITNDRLPKVSSNLSRVVTDGTRLYFPETLPGGFALVEVSTQGGETTRVPLDLESPAVYDISPNRSELLVGGGPFKGVSPERPLWVMPLPSGPPHRLGDIVGHDACWARDGRHLVFVNDKDVYVAQPDGSEVRKLATVGGFADKIRFSPDGKRLRFTVLTASTHPETWEVMEMGADGSGLHHLPVRGCCGAWSSDGKYYFYQTGEGVSKAYTNIWAVPERHSILGGVGLGTPAQLTAGPLAFDLPTPSLDGKHLFVVGHQERIDLVRYDGRSKQLVPFLGGISAGELEVSPDGQWIAYTTYPESTLWRSKLDGSERLQLTFAPMNAHEPRWSPDGKQILFTDVPLKIFVVAADGGAPRQLLPGDHPTVIGAGAWLPDGNHIVFGRAMGCAVEDYRCYERAAVYLLDLKTQRVSKLAGSDGMIAARVSRDGCYVAAISIAGQKMMLYDFQTAKWSELAQGTGTVVWSRDSKFVYLDLHRVSQPDNLVRISVPDGKIERVLDLKDITLGGYWPDWISLLPDDSPLLMLDRSTQEIYRLDLQYR